MLEVHENRIFDILNSVNDESSKIQELFGYLKTNEIISMGFFNRQFDESAFRVFCSFVNSDDQIQELDLSGCKLGDQRLDMLSKALATNRTLVVLNLLGNDITDEGIKYLADLVNKNKIIEIISLTNNKITDVGGKLLLDILKSSDIIKFLGINKNAIGFKTLIGLSEMIEPRLAAVGIKVS